MASEKQIRANNLNAKKSTGPTSAAGKRRASENSITHGLTGARLLVPGEDEEEFRRFRQSLFDGLQPVGGFELQLVEEIVIDSWRLRRVPCAEAGLLRRAMATVCLGPVVALEDRSFTRGEIEAYG